MLIQDVSSENTHFAIYISELLQLAYYRCLHIYSYYKVIKTS